MIRSATRRPVVPPDVEAARDAVLGAVTGSLIHAIGQPLTIMRLAAERPDGQVGLDAAAAEVVVDQVARLEAIFQGLDGLARAGRGPVRAQPLVPVLHAALELLDPLTAARGAPAVSLAAAPEVAEAVIEGPDGLLMLLGVALLHESLEAAQERISVSLTLSAAEPGSEPGGGVVLTVEDDRPQGRAAFGGHAVAVARALAGRCLPAASGLRLHLPAATAPAARPEPAAPSADRPVRVLLVEDEALIAEMMAERLTEHGFPTTVRGSIAEALAALEVEVPDAVVTDLSLPDGPGEVLLDRLARDWPHVFTIALSGREPDTAAMPDGAVDMLLRKPASPEKLAETLRRLVAAR
ncbi:response regulator [Caenispirillum salinarum]|uniref:response regulator n=1 Tax=Caenispirillum salinarum TaxID=859058 RepID=UPI00384FB129